MYNLVATVRYVSSRNRTSLLYSLLLPTRVQVIRSGDNNNPAGSVELNVGLPTKDSLTLKSVRMQKRILRVYE